MSTANNVTAKTATKRPGLVSGPPEGTRRANLPELPTGEEGSHSDNGVLSGSHVDVPQEVSVEREVAVSLLDDSPFQPRTRYDQAEIDALCDTLAAGGQAELMKVRLKADGRYELITGHRRKRAAIKLGWKTVRVLVVNADDYNAEKQAMLSCVGNVGLSDYELARMFERAKSQKFARTQEEIGQFFGFAQEEVSGRLALLKLPQPILAKLDEDPELFGYACGKDILRLVKDYPDSLEVIVKGVERLQGGSPQSGLKAWVMQMISQKKVTDGKGEPRVVTDSTGKAVFTLEREGTDLVVRSKKGSNATDIEDDLHAWLLKRIQGAANL